MPKSVCGVTRRTALVGPCFRCVATFSHVFADADDGGWMNDSTCDAIVPSSNFSQTLVIGAPQCTTRLRLKTHRWWIGDSAKVFTRTCWSLPVCSPRNCVVHPEMSGASRSAEEVPLPGLCIKRVRLRTHRWWIGDSGKVFTRTCLLDLSFSQTGL